MALTSDAERNIDFDTLEEALNFYKEVEVNNRQWASDNLWIDGYVERIDGEEDSVTGEKMMVMVHKGRWGFYPCSHETYLKLKVINKVITKTASQLANWKRWSIKMPYNRVRRVYSEPYQCKISSDRVGWVRGHLLETVPVPEPQVCLIFVEKVQRTDFLDMTGQYHSNKVTYEVYLPNKDGRELLSKLVRDYGNARTPVGDEKDVTPLYLSDDMIDRIYQMCLAE